MISASIAKKIITELKTEAYQWEGLRSLTLHGSQVDKIEDNYYTDVDIIFVCEDRTIRSDFLMINQFFNNECQKHSDSNILCLFRIESGPMHPLRSHNKDSPIIPLSQRRIVFFHISLFSESFYRGTQGYPGPSPLLIYSWQELTPLIGLPLGKIRFISRLDISDVLNSGLGIRESICMLKNGKKSFWKWSETSENGMKLEWVEEPFKDFDAFDIPIYIIKWVIENSVRALSGTMPFNSRISSKEIFIKFVLGSEFHNIDAEVNFFYDNIHDLRKQYTESLEAFLREYDPYILQNIILGILEHVENSLEAIEEMVETNFEFKFLNKQIPIGVTVQLQEKLMRFVQKNKPDKILIITDDNLMQIYDIARWLQVYGVPVSQVSLISGPSSKSIDGLAKLLVTAEELGINSQSLIVIFGGGNVGNLGGTVAGMVCRGVPFVQIPTTVIGQLDSAISAKQSVNGIKGKNYFGLFHPPNAILVNPLLLKTLSEYDIRSGLVEALKHGLCQSEELIKIVKCYATSPHQDLFTLEKIITETIKLKLDYLKVDPYENAPTQFLELGHKVGHALESTADGTISHGMCVAIGIIAEAHFFQNMGRVDESITKYLIDAVKKVVGSIYLPKDLENETIACQLLFDNKRRGNRIPFAYLRNFQEPISSFEELNEGAIHSFTDSIRFARNVLK